MKRISLAILLLALSASAHAFRFKVEWKNPTTNTDNSPLTDLSSIEIEWGTCNGTLFGTYKGGALIATSAVGANMSTFIEGQADAGTTKVCVRAFAIAATGAKSDSSNVAVKQLLPEPGKPVTLGQPVILSFNQE